MHVAVIFPCEFLRAGEVSETQLHHQASLAYQCSQGKILSCELRCLRAVSSDANCSKLGGSVSGVTGRMQRIWSDSPDDTVEEFDVLEMLVHVCAGIGPPLERLLAAIWPGAPVYFLLGLPGGFQIFINIFWILHWEASVVVASGRWFFQYRSGLRLRCRRIPLIPL